MLILDCYNVLHSPMPAMLAGLDEAGLCRALARTSWVTHKGGVVVVADGKPKPLPGDVSGQVLRESPVDGVRLEWSGPGRSADSVIIRMVNEHSAPRRVTVVSTDREVRAKARRRRCRVWTSEQFVTKLVEQLRQGGGVGDASNAPTGPQVPPEGLSAGEVAKWMEAFGIDETDVGPPIDPSAPRDPGRTADDRGKRDEPPKADDDPFNIPGVWPPW